MVRIARVLDTTPEELLEEEFSSSFQIETEKNERRCIALIQAGGRSTTNLLNIPNQFVNVDGKPIIVYILEVYERHPLIDEIVVVCAYGWEKLLESYVKKYKLNKDENCFSIFTSDDNWGNIFSSESKAKILRYSSSTEFCKNAYGILDEHDKGWIENKLVLDKTLVPGHHMKENLLNAAIVMSIMKVPLEKICKILSEYKGIHHRLEYFYEYKNSTGKNFIFYNDSAATVPEAAAAAISSSKAKISASKVAISDSKSAISSSNS